MLQRPHLSPLSIVTQLLLVLLYITHSFPSSKMMIIVRNSVSLMSSQFRYPNIKVNVNSNQSRRQVLLLHPSELLWLHWFVMTRLVDDSLVWFIPQVQAIGRSWWWDYNIWFGIQSWDRDSESDEVSDRGGDRAARLLQVYLSPTYLVTWAQHLIQKWHRWSVAVLLLKNWLIIFPLQNICRWHTRWIYQWCCEIC